MYESLSLFAEPTRVWFERAFGEPTEAQAQAWPAIRSGRNVLVIAPTGSGKTLAAFLSAIDRLMVSPRPRHGRKGVRVLYISPLKALAVDVAKNLERPLEGIAVQCEAQGMPAPTISVATRSGDTTAQERRRIASHPPDILVTTPESLYLLLTSKAGRILSTVDTVIVDEIHAVAGTKRGAHLALSLERLERLVVESHRREAMDRDGGDGNADDGRAGGGRMVQGVPAGNACPAGNSIVQDHSGIEMIPAESDGLASGGSAQGGSASGDSVQGEGAPRVIARDTSPLQRIGLSATVNPPEEAARFLGGGRPVTIVNPGGRPAMALRMVEPLADMRDLDSANVPQRAGGVDVPPGGHASMPHISGVTPAMQRLAERRGLIEAQSGGLRVGELRSGDQSGSAGGLDVGGHTNMDGAVEALSDSGVDFGAESGAGESVGGRSDSSAIVGARGDRTSGSIWPVVERSILDEILTHRTTLVFVNSRGVAEKLTARLNDMYAAGRGGMRGVDAGVQSVSETHGDDSDGRSDGTVGKNDHGESAVSAHASHSDDSSWNVGSPEGREGFAAHYDAVVGSTTMLVGSHEGEDVIAMAHHGSVSKDRRKLIEERLKHGELRCVVATSSLELGIDMGSVDLVIQVDTPLSVSSGLQRVGRADHQVGGVSHALFYPLTRMQIVTGAASLEAMATGDIEPLAVPRNPLDVLAQQTVAAASMHDLDADEWYATVRRAAPFAKLPRDMFDAVIGMMSGAYNAEEFSAFKPRLMWNREDGIISARPGAQKIAVTSGGTIPDRGLYTVVLPEADAGKGQRRVGELDEEMVYESRVGDVITLGTSTWQIQEITRDRVVVTPAPGRTARLPFWHGEGAGRDYGFSRTIGRFLRETSTGLVSASSLSHKDSETISGTPLREKLKDAMPHTGEAIPGVPLRGELSAQRTEGSNEETPIAATTPSSPTFSTAILNRLRRDGLDDNAISNLARLLAEQRSATGVVPDDRTLVVERTRDEDGGWRVVLLSPFGRRVHEPWAMAISRRLATRYGFDGQAYAADDGIVIQLPDGEGHIPMADLFLFDPEDLRADVERQVGESVLFAARFRECAARALFMPRSDPGRRVPLWQQRLRAAQLLQSARTAKNFPLLLETARECLQDVYDMPALDEVMTGLQSGAIVVKDVETDTPSPFAENILFGFVGAVMYQYDQPQAERSAQLLSLDPQVLERLLGSTDMAQVLDPDVIRDVERELKEHTFWNELADDDLTGRVTRYAKTHGPFTVERLISDLHLTAEDAVHTLDALAAKGELLQGHFMDMDSTDADSGGMVSAGGGDATVQWLHKEVFRRIRSRSLAKARKTVKPVEPSAYQMFLLDRQGVGPVGGERYEGADGLMRVIEQLEGVTLPAALWESFVFPARVRDYQPALLDELLTSGDVIWVGSKTGATGALETGEVAFRPADSLLLDSMHSGLAPSASLPSGRVSSSSAPSGTVSSGLAPSGTAPSGTIPPGQGGPDGPSVTMPESILAALDSGGAFHARQLADAAKRVWNETAEPDIDPNTGEIIPQEWSERQFKDALWSLVWQGRVTNSSFAPVRALSAGSSTPRKTGASHRRGRVAPIRRAVTDMTLGGLWSAVPGAHQGAEDMQREQAERLLALIDALLDRYGIIAQPLVDRENVPGGYSALYPVLKRMEEHGCLVRGMFVRGFGAAQFAERETVDALRHPLKERSHSVMALSALDPANLAGTAIGWPAITANAAKPVRRAGSVVVLGAQGPMLYATVKSKRLTVFDSSDHPDATTDSEDRLRRAASELAYALKRDGSGTVTFADVNGEPLNARHPFARILHQAGFVPVPQGMRLY
ncbi:DEAD/DEAH box helicase [Bifidobacterium myosotis]|uniref:DEAD/DEAH box helicase n=1 Tax=Bifidobacterium myosotis TaxID=1630166 RepID=A0A5M9ZJ81_9BIFI|nr:DEAD/DEAH box helicase [Bifidobacterium myosotis]KAA8827687.1 DEAD/DEAH box helicase [Bifidobacterium myosotis]